MVSMIRVIRVIHVVRVIRMVRMVIVLTVLVFCVRVAMAMIVFVQTFHQFLTLIQQMSLLVSDLILKLRNLNLNLF